MPLHYNDYKFGSGYPQLIGVLGDNCASCDSTTVPLYELSCHESDDFHCRDCLTKKWFEADDEVVRCPHPSCGTLCGFMLLNPLSNGLHLSSHFYDTERLDRLRQQEVMDNQIAFTREEADITLQNVYSLFEDQLLDPVLLGGVPGRATQHAPSTFEAASFLNPIYTGMLAELTSAPKLMTSPLVLEEDLYCALEALLYEYAKEYCTDELIALRVDLGDKNAVVEVSVESFKLVRDIKDNWRELISKWVDLLSWRHLERVSPPEGSAAERQY